MADNQNPYPFPSIVHVLSSLTLKLNDSNYLLWKTQFESLLSSQTLLGFVNGVALPPVQTRTVTRDNVQIDEPNPLYDAWFCSDQLVRSWIYGTLSEEVLGTVHTFSTSREVCASFSENFNKSSLVRGFSLRLQPSAFNQERKEFSYLLQRFQIHL